MPKDQKHMNSARLCEINKYFINEKMNKWMIALSWVFQGKAGLYSYASSYLIFHVCVFPRMYFHVYVPLCLETFGLEKSALKHSLAMWN